MKIHVHIDDAQPFDIEVADGDKASASYHSDIQAKALAHPKVVEALGEHDHHVSKLYPLTISRCKLTITTQEVGEGKDKAPADLVLTPDQLAAVADGLFIDDLVEVHGLPGDAIKLKTMSFPARGNVVHVTRVNGTDEYRLRLERSHKGTVAYADKSVGRTRAIQIAKGEPDIDVQGFNRD